MKICSLEDQRINLNIQAKILKIKSIKKGNKDKIIKDNLQVQEMVKENLIKVFKKVKDK
jgi:hypothetical protein